MKLENRGSAFTVIYNGQDYLIPAGQFEVSSDKLGYFIMKKVMNWKNDVSIIEDSAKDFVAPIKSTTKKEEVKEETKEEEIKEEVKEETKPTSKRGRPSKIKELEESL